MMRRILRLLRGDPDATLKLRPRRRRAIAPMLASSVLGLVSVFAALWMVFRTPAQKAHADKAEPPPLADEAALLAAPTDRLTLWRFRADPDIVVAIFPTLHAQAMALNRVATFVERPGVPRDHVLDDGALRAVIGQGQPGGQDGFDTYYYGHDYRAADLARFFATAASDGVNLHAAERELKARLKAAGLFKPRSQLALISLPPHGDGLLDDGGRATILDHELSHGAYFTDPRYAAYVVGFWNGLTETERSAFRRYLGAQGYDTGNDDLMRNETQAYLVFTADPRMFDMARLGLPEAPRLRTEFLSGLPVDWLRQDAVKR
jgi:hypothetical protein